LEVIGPRGGPSAVKVHQDARVLVSRLNPGVEVSHPIGDGRGLYAYLIDGEASFDGEPVASGDAAKVTDQDALRIRAIAPSELILVDVPLEFPRVGIWAHRG
jgi:redox-sensitive bicupin YhaK (pirin superfamily)